MNVAMLVCPSVPYKRNFTSDYGPCKQISSSVYTQLVTNKKIPRGTTIKA